MIELKITNHSKAEYTSMEQFLRNKAHEFAQRAQAYIIQGKLDKAIGCLNKAIVKTNRANLLKISPLEEALFGSTIKNLSDAIAKNIMEG